MPQIQGGAPLETFDYCLVGKTHRVVFHTNHPTWRLNVIDLIHTDVYKMQTRTLDVSLYFVTFIDYHSRKSVGFCVEI